LSSFFKVESEQEKRLTSNAKIKIRFIKRFKLNKINVLKELNKFCLSNFAKKN
jgi:hypothetical protein